MYRKKKTNLINIAICDDDLIFASKVETILLEISKKQMIKMNIEVFSDGDQLNYGMIFKWERMYINYYIWTLRWIELME